jgi:hypothetical protein
LRKENVLKILTVALALFLLCGLYVQSFGTFSLAEMDWNHDGSTSIAEILLAGDYRLDVTQSAGLTCRTIVRLKDGLDVSRACVADKRAGGDG